MARQVQRLSARSVAVERKPGMHADGLGLYLYVSKSVAKSWIYRFMLRGRSRDMGLGGLDVVSLSDAREHALEARKLVKAGVDPIEERNAERAREAVDASSRMTFADCARALIKSHEAGWRNPKHRQQWRNTLAGSVRAKSITLPDRQSRIAPSLILFDFCGWTRAVRRLHQAFKILL